MEFEKAKVQFVVKTSKYCNLRCRYCYEYAELNNKTAMSLTQLEQMFQNIANYYRTLDFPVEIQFVWHGGEQLLQPPKFYWQMFELQRLIFGDLANYVSNSVQTNLTVISPEHIRLLRDGFKGAGVSIDLFGGLRQHRIGFDSQEIVLKNIDRLRAENIPVGCISVLTKLNLPYMPQMYQFYRELGIGFRVLPLFKGAFVDQHQGFEITAQETLQAYKTLVDLWLADERIVNVAPIVEYFQQILHYYNPSARPVFYDKRQWEPIYQINTDGNVYSYADAYEIEWSHGNIFTTPFEQIVHGTQHQKVIAAAEMRMVATCQYCPYFGSCTGFPIAEGNLEYNEVDEQGVTQCVVDQGILHYIEQRLCEAGILDPQNRKLLLDLLVPQQSNTLLSKALR